MPADAVSDALDELARDLQQCLGGSERRWRDALDHAIHSELPPLRRIEVWNPLPRRSRTRQLLARSRRARRGR